MSEKFTCGRRNDLFAYRGNEKDADYWRDDNSCSYCGSLNPDEFMSRVEAGDVTLTPTDKNYKVYIENDGGESFKQTYRDCPQGTPPHMPDECSHWVTQLRNGAKFYFQHLTDEQKQRFVNLYNQSKIKLDYPGYFYRMPFFMKVADSVEP